MKIEQILNNFDKKFATDFANDGEYSDKEMVEIMSNVIKKQYTDFREFLETSLKEISK